jgi:hypothetical protein
VLDNGVTFLQFDFHVETIGCSADERVTLFVRPPEPVVNKSFTVDVSVAAGVKAYAAAVSGSFSSHTQASGSMPVHYAQIRPLPPCSVDLDLTWSANRTSAALLGGSILAESGEAE